MHIVVINTSNQANGWNLTHDAAKPYAVVQMSNSGSIIRTIARYATYKGACIARGKYRMKMTK